MTEKGHCKHGEFDLETGCPQCIAERQAAAQHAEPEQLIPEDALEQAPFLRQVEEDIGAVEPAAETALALAPGADVEVMSYYDGAQKCLEYAKSRVIATAKDIEVLNDDLSIIGKLKKAMEKKRREYLDPLKAQADAIRDTYNYLMAPVLEADKITRDKILAFTKEQNRIRAEEEEINRKRTEAAQAEMRLKGELTESVNLVEVTPEAPKHVSTELGLTGQVDHWKWEVIDFSQLPDEYKVVDGSLLTAVAKKHHDQKPVPGVKFYNEPYIAVRTR